MSDIEKDNQNLICLIDWLSCTVKTQEYIDEAGRTARRDVTLDAVYKLLGIPESEWQDMPTGLHGYHHQRMCDDIKILHGGMANMGIHIQMSGQACRQWETYWGDSWENLFDRLMDHDCNISRLDIAVDDIRYGEDKPYFRVPDLIRRVKRGLCRSKWRDLERQEKIKVADGTSRGHTAYFGSSKSLIRLRVYEKDKERVAEGFDLEEGLSAWNRAELQLRDDRAQMAMQWILKGMSGGELFMGILSQYVNFVDKTEDSHRERWPVSQFWQDYLGDALKLRLTAKAPDKTIPRKQAWLQEQVEATLAEVWYATGGPGEESFVAMLERGLERMSEAHWMRAEAFRAQMIRLNQEEKDKREVRSAYRIAEENERSRAHTLALAGDFQAQQKGDAVTSPSQDLQN